MKTGYLGTMSVPEQEREEFAQRVLELMKQGGMMQMKHTSGFGEVICVLAEPEFDRSGAVHACFNYFSDEDRYDMTFHGEDADFWVPETGSGAYSKVAHAVHTLYEMYAEEPGLAFAHGCGKEYQKALGWINTVCHTDYCARSEAERQAVCLYHLKKHGDQIPLRMYWENPSWEELLNGFAANGLFDEEFKAALPDIDISELVWLARDVAEEIYMADGPRSERLLFMELASRMPDSPVWFEDHGQPWWKAYAIVAKILPKEILDALTVLAFQPEPHELPVKSELRVSAERVSTGEYFGVSDDDRLYYWRPDGDVSISEEVEQWLTQLSEEYSAIAEASVQTLPADRAVQEFFRTLKQMEQLFPTVYCMQQMLNDFMEHGGEVSRQAMLWLLKRMILSGENGIPEAAGQRSGRQEVKRLLAVWANPGLRRRVFGF